MFADDGIFIDEEKNILDRIRETPEIRNSGIILSTKIKSNGKPACREVTGELEFLGLCYDIVADKIKISDN